MVDATRRENEQFEYEVRRIARALWPSAEFSGATILEGQETDGIFETEDCIHIVEATTSRRMEKAKQDIAKLTKLLSKFQSKSRTRAVRGWFVTRDEPTADQRRITDRHRNSVNTLSFSQFQARLIDSNAYLNARDAYPFGSVRNPATGKPSPNSKDIKYVPLDLVQAESNEVYSREDFRSLIAEGRTVVLLGDFGAGKSMTLWEVYRDLRKEHLRARTSKFPVYLNLRDHYGQIDPAELITRHARSIGFAHPSHLVRAWRAGYVHLLIDGFDEISMIAIQGLWHDLKKNRYRAMEPVRRLIREHPSGAALLVTGRAHFFNNSSERHRALNLPQNSIELSLNEFTEVQIHNYLRRMGLSGSIPSWLPSRPLLVSYLAAKGLLSNLFGEESADQPMSPAAGWDTLLDNITAREAEIEAGIDGSTVRRILERLATKVRTSQVGVGSLNPDSIVQAFRDICGYNPDERGLILLQRLPGLGVDREEENSRIFVDEVFADACKAGDLLAFVNNPFDFPSSVLAEVESSIGTLGVEIASLKGEARGFGEGKINTALVAACKAGAKYMAADIARLTLEGGFCIRANISLEGLLIPDLELDTSSADLSKLQFQNCFFSHVAVDPTLDTTKIPSFCDCFIDELEGRVSASDLPTEKFDNKCYINKFTRTAETTAQVLALDLPLGMRVCLTVLKKLYERSGSGRKESALYRGLDNHARRLVPRVLQVLRSEGFTFLDKAKKNTIWYPCRSHRDRARRMIVSPSTNDDPVLQRCGSLSK